MDDGRVEFWTNVWYLWATVGLRQYSNKGYSACSWINNCLLDREPMHRSLFTLLPDCSHCFTYTRAYEQKGSNRHANTQTHNTQTHTQTHRHTHTHTPQHTHTGKHTTLHTHKHANTQTHNTHTNTQHTDTQRTHMQTNCTGFVMYLFMNHFLPWCLLL